MFRRVRISRDFITTALELIGAGLVTAGVYVLFGVGVSLLVGGVFMMAFSYLAAGS